MTLLVLGIALWWGVHWLKRLAPDLRARVSVLPLHGLAALAIILMIFGYRMADGAVFWGRHPATVGILNLAMIFALYFTSPGPKRGALFYRMRHPMLTGFAIWALAHLLVNGDLPSLILFGGLGAWALLSIPLINRAEPDWTPPEKGTIAKDAMFLGASVVLLLVIGFVHTWLGAPAFG